MDGVDLDEQQLLMVSDVLAAFLLQIAFTVGIIILFGRLIALCNKRFYANFGGLSRTVCYATGFIGTPVHELSHALFCVLFGHKIVEIKLFQVDAADGTLGYVRHAYNKKNLYQRMGNFFIGVAPILVISALLFLALYVLLPSFYTEILRLADGFSLRNIGKALGDLGAAVVSFFTLATAWQWWVFLLTGALLCLHMTLSGADIKGALSGLFFVAAAFLVADVILELLDPGLLVAFTKQIMRAGSYLFCFLLLALFISVTAMAISFVIRAIRRKAR